MIVAEYMEDAVHKEHGGLQGQRQPVCPRLALRHARAHDHVTEEARRPRPGGTRRRRYDLARLLQREGEHVRGAVDLAIVAVEGAHAALAHERDAELAGGHALGHEHGASERRHGRLVHDKACVVVDLYGEQAHEPAPSRCALAPSPPDRLRSARSSASL